MLLVARLIGPKGGMILLSGSQPYMWYEISTKPRFQRVLRELSEELGCEIPDGWNPGTCVDFEVRGRQAGVRLERKGLIERYATWVYAAYEGESDNFLVKRGEGKNGELNIYAPDKSKAARVFTDSVESRLKRLMIHSRDEVSTEQGEILFKSRRIIYEPKRMAEMINVLCDIADGIEKDA
ncbi:MAG: hypothetical protein V1875_09820 [Candidatus Altiarchaeota archaeon]